MRIGSTRAGSRRGGPGWSASHPPLCHSCDYRIDRFHMTGIRSKHHQQTRRRSIDDRESSTSVVLHISGPADTVARMLVSEGVFELGKNLIEGCIQDLSHHVESSPMAHPDKEVGALQTAPRSRSTHPTSVPMYPDLRVKTGIFRGMRDREIFQRIPPESNARAAEPD